MLMFASKNAAIECKEDTDSVLLAAIKPKAALTGSMTGSKEWVQPNQSMDGAAMSPQPSSPLPLIAWCVQRSSSEASLILLFF